MPRPNDRIQLPDTEIATRAYERWIARGCPISDGKDDWFAARSELEAERRTSTPAHVVRRKSAKSASARVAAAR
jgi:hypothetical protein